MKLQIKNSDQGEDVAAQATASERRSVRISPVIAGGIIFFIGILLGAGVLLNINQAATSLADLEARSALRTTAWVFGVACIAFSGLAAAVAAVLLARLNSSESLLSTRGLQLEKGEEAIRKMEVEVTRTKADLDRRVQERTRELADANKFLITEINDRKVAQQELAAEKERLMTTLRSIMDGVIATDADNRIVLMNKIAESLTGWSQEEAMKKSLYEVFNVHEEETGLPVNNILEKILASGGQPEVAHDLELTGKDGREKVVSLSSAPIYDEDANLLGLVIAFRDVTERLRVEEERMKTQKLESIALLAGGIAHDYNNLLTAVLGNLSLAQMSMQDTPDEVPGLLHEVESAANRARDLTRQLLTFAKGGAPIRQTATLTDMIRDSAEFVLRGSATRCEYNFAEDTAPAEVDLGQISQVIQNLVINADQAMPGGGKISIRTENIQISTEQKGLPLKPGSYVKITVGDNGPGMPPEVLAKIFEAYFTTKEKGSGLGLTTSFSIVRKHDGHISVASKQGEGTTFFIYLPAADTEEAQGIGKSQPLVLQGNGRILAMDDEAPVRTIVKRMLESVGYKVTVARDGGEVLRLYEEAEQTGKPFDALILDLTVAGGMGGRETLRQLQMKYKNVKAIVCSGYTNDPVMEKYRKFGFTGMVAKPFTVGDLSHTLKRILS